MKLESGDAFERKHADWIRHELPHYEQVWSTFIGHDGSGKPCEIEGLDEEAEEDRKRFYQAHYSFARSMRRADRIAEELDRTLGSVASYDDFEQEIDRLTDYFSAVGNVRDMFKLVTEALKPEVDLHAPLQDFYAKRSHIIHAPRLPAKLDGGLLKVPRTGGKNLKIGEWDNRSTWDSIPDQNFIFLRDFVCESSTEFKALVNDVHGKVFNAADRRFSGRRINEPEVPRIQNPSHSGDCFYPAISAFEYQVDSVPISGFRPTSSPSAD
jgi:hypothetical protein